MSLRVYVRVVNNNSCPVTILLKDVTADGTPVYGAGVSGIAANSDTGNNSNEYFLFKPEYTSDDAAARALRNASSLTMTVHAFNRDTYDDIIKEPCEINIAALGGTDAYDDYPSEDYGYDSSANYAPAYTPASYDFQTLKQGSKGQAVRDLQQRLTDLGYLCDKIDGSYGRNTNTAVRSFCDQHGLVVSNEATPEMQQLLYSSNAQYYSEPYIPLVIGATFKKDTPIEFGGYGSYDGRITIQLVNRSSTRGIRGYVLYYYQTNMYGEKINLAPSGTLYEAYFDEMNYIEPAHYKDALSYVIKNYYGTYAVYVGIQKIVFDDGEIREIDPSDIDYYECVIAD